MSVSPNITVAKPNEFAPVASAVIEGLLRQALEREPGRIVVALAGGSTPGAVYQKLSEATLAWDRVDLILGDERLVAPSDEQSNYRMVCERLLRGPAQAATLHGVTLAAAADESARGYEQVVRSLFGSSQAMPQIHLTILGVGDDGHTASLFPYSEALAEAERFIVPAAHPVTAQARVTLTIPAITMSQEMIFLVAGKPKRDILTAVLRPGDMAQYPARIWSRAQGRVHFVVDSAAHEGGSVC